MGTGKSELRKGIKNITAKVRKTKLKVKSWRNLSAKDAAQHYSDLYKAMSSDELYTLGLNDNGLQRLVHDLDMHSPGVVLPDSDYDAQVDSCALNGVELYRGANQRAIDSIMYGDLSYMGDGIHGDGLYFSTSAKTAQDYGVVQTTAYIDKNLARVIKEDSLYRMLDREPIEVRRLFRGDSGLSAYAIYKGYNVIHAPGGNGSRSVALYGTKNGVDYYVPLTREILVFRKHNREYDPSKWRAE